MTVVLPTGIFCTPRHMRTPSVRAISTTHGRSAVPGPHSRARVRATTPLLSPQELHKPPCESKHFPSSARLLS